MHGCVVVRERLEYITVVHDYDENYVCAGINAASQEVFSMTQGVLIDPVIKT